MKNIFKEIRTRYIEFLDYRDESQECFINRKGEIVAMVFSQETDSLEEEELKNKIKLLKEDGFSQKDISKILSKLYGANKNKVYKLALE